jgi:hypothetical protein
MNYFIRGLFTDTRYWIGILFLVLLGLSLVEITSLTFLPRPIFHGWALISTLVFGGTLFLVLMRETWLRDKKARALTRQLPAFERMRKNQLKEHLEKDPGFQTFCYQCHHFHSGRADCTLHMFQRKMTVRFDSQPRTTYCLYWNADIPRELIEDVR